LINKGVTLTILLAAALVFAPASFATTRTVTNCADSGAGSLRQEIADASAGDEIVFSITTLAADYSTGEVGPGLVTNEVSGAQWFRIMLATAISISSDISIEGSSQPTNEADNPYGPEIEIRAPGAIAFYVNGNNNRIDHLIVNKSATGILLAGDHNQVAGCYLGTCASGESSGMGNGTAINITDQGENNTIGGTSAVDRNIISGNTNSGIYINGVSNEVLGNYIGIDADGASILANGTSGIYIDTAGANNRIGGQMAGGGNIISGNAWGISIFGASGSKIQGNYIGTDANGMADLGNTQSGIALSYNAQYNTIGGPAAGERNIISGNDRYGIQISSANSNEVYGNYIGLGADGQSVLANGYQGIKLEGVTGWNKIGTSESGGANVIVANNGIDGYGFDDSGIFMNGGSGAVQNNFICNNIIGLTSAESVPATKGMSGVYLYNGPYENYILSNVISGNQKYGVIISNWSNNNEVAGNFIGVDSSGTSRCSNEVGVFIYTNSHGNRVGGSTPEKRNIISGQGKYGIAISYAYSNDVYGNYIGVEADGITPLPNDEVGILIKGSSSNHVGSAESDSHRNIISGNTSQPGIYLDGSSNNYIEGNWIGLGTDESVVANWCGIIAMNTSQSNIITSNAISGNSYMGIWLGYGASGGNTTSNEVKSNYIGTNASGTAARPNGNTGLRIDGGASYNIIGGDTTFEGNVISGNSIMGVVISSTGTQGNILKNNIIGLNKDTTSMLPNVKNGVYICYGAEANRIGVPGMGRNIISGNNWYGIDIDSADTNIVCGNYIGFASDGETVMANGLAGVLVESVSQNNLIGTSETNGGNLIVASSETGTAGIRLDSQSVSNNHVYNNVIGLTRTESIPAEPGANGIILGGGADGNHIGGAGPDEGNVISGNNQYGIWIKSNDTNSNEVAGNFIGVDSSGTNARSNEVGVLISVGARYNKIGDGTDMGKNVISGNTVNGIQITGTNTTSNEVMGNIIGLNLTGMAAVANGSAGIQIDSGANYNMIGGDASSEGNIISGNTGFGIYILQSNTNNNEINNNIIGLDLNRTNKIPNSYGIYLNTVGAHQIRGNIISGNTNNGILIQGDTFGTVTISQNIIGTNYPDFASGLGNGQQGICNNGRSSVVIGPGNTIAYNGYANFSEGIRIQNSDSVGNVITQNSIFSNYSKGIAISNGANPTTSTPEVITADHNDGTGLTLITGESATANGTVEVFKAEGNQGKTYLGSTIASGTGSWLINVPSLVSGDAVAATGTTANPETSEFSQTKEVITTVFKEYQPDSLIATLESGSDYVGENVFNLDGTDQTRARTIANGTSVTYYIKIENDANTTDEVVVKGRGSSGDWGLAYYDAKTGGNDITSSITGEGWVTGVMTSGASKEVRMVVANSGSANSTLEALVTSESKTQAAMKDAVKAITVAVTTTTTTTTTTSTTTTIVPAKHYTETDLNVPGLTIDIPAGALTADATVTATVVSAPADPPAGFMIGGTIVNIQPTGLVFTAPVTITLSINGPLADPHIYFWDGIKWSTEGITLVSYTNTLLTFTTTHFTTFAPMAAIPSNLVRFGPNPYNPSSGSGRFWYWLSEDKETTIYLADLGGTVVWKATYPAGGNGGKANENNVAYDGKTAWGDALGNGVYIYKIVQDGKAIGGGKIAVIK
jgi:hypothetical protein